MGKAPAFQFYAGDFLTGTTLMTNAEVGLYIRLLCLQAEHGAIPDDVERITAAFGPSCKAIWPVVRSKFTIGPADGLLVNERMTTVLLARDAFRERQSAKGKASAQARSGLTKSKPRRNRGSTMVEPLGDRDRVLIQGRKEPTIEIVWPKWAGPNTLAKWEEFKTYKMDEFKDRYASAKSEQRSINLLAKWFETGKECVDALDEAMGRKWQFPVDPSKRISHNSPATPTPILNANGKPQQLKPWVN